MESKPSAPSEVALLDAPDLVCVSTSKSQLDVDLWQATLGAAGIPCQVQRVSVRDYRQAPRVAYLLYVHPADEERAMRLLQPRRDLPIFPLAHLRETSW